MKLNKLYAKPEIALISASEILTLKGSGEGNDDLLEWDNPNGDL